MPWTETIAGTRTQRAYDAITLGEGRTSTSALSLVTDAYASGVTDEFIEPGVVVDQDGQPIGTVVEGDAVVFFNFRADRARQLTRALAFGDEFDGFARRTHPRVSVTTMTEYDATYGLPVAFEPQAFASNLADVLADSGLSNLRLAETEKYAHVTYFFNSGEERPYRGEERLLVPSAKVPTYDLKPEMSAAGITEQLVADVTARRHNVIICNFANADMVGHTGNLDAAITAVSTLDGCLETIIRAVETAGGTAVITADHRQRRDDVGPGTQRSAYGPYDQPSAGSRREPGRAWAWLLTPRRLAQRRRADDARNPGDSCPNGNDRSGSPRLDRRRRRIRPRRVRHKPERSDYSTS